MVIIRREKDDGTIISVRTSKDVDEARAASPKTVSNHSRVPAARELHQVHRDDEAALRGPVHAAGPAGPARRRDIQGEFVLVSQKHAFVFL